jgi:D-3-phosphoglycerate dehydrogenase
MIGLNNDIDNNNLIDEIKSIFMTIEPIRVLISDKLSPRSVEIFKEAGIQVDVHTGMNEEELCNKIADYHGLAIRSATKVTKKVLDAAVKLKIVARAGIGVDNVDIKAATEHGVVVMNTPFGNSITTAEHAIAMMFALARQIPEANRSTHAGLWEKNRFMGVELTAKTLGLIGCGNIGSIVADRAQGLKMRVIAYDPFLSAERARDLHLEKVTLDELLERSDFITLHTPLNDTTRNILNAQSLLKAKKSVRIINCARGGLIDEAALVDAIRCGHVAGAALDVFEEEPAKENPLFGLEQVIATPHLGASTIEAQENVAIQVAEQMVDYLLQGTVTNALNIPSVSAEDAAKLKPYLNLANQLGQLSGQIMEGALKSIQIEYEGAVTKLNTKPITAVLLKGILEPIVQDVNMVNASMVAASRNVAVSEVKHDRKSDYQTVVRVVLETESGREIIAGTLFSGTKARVIEIGGVQLEAGLGDRMLFINNEDKPGFIGSLGRLLGDAAINIANFNLGRSSAGANAIALIEVDQEVPDVMLGKIKLLPSVRKVKMLVFS